MNNIQLRARIKVIDALVRKYNKNEEYSKLISLGFIPDKIKQEYESMLNDYSEKITDNSALSSLELSTYSTFLQLHPNKIIGEEKEGSVYINPIATKGNVSELENVIPRFQKNKMENIDIKEEFKNEDISEKIESVIDIIDEEEDDSINYAIALSNSIERSEKDIDGVFTVQETIDKFNSHLPFEEIQAWVYYKRLFGNPMKGWEKYYLKTTSKEIGSVVVAKEDLMLKDNHFRDLRIVPNGTVIGYKTRFSNEYGGENYFVCRTEQNELVYVTSSKVVEENIGNKPNQEEIDELVKKKALCYYRDSYLPIPVYVFGNIYEIEDELLGVIDTETKERSGGDYGIIADKYGKDVADFHVELVKKARERKGEYLFNDPRPSYRPFLSGNSQLATNTDFFYVRELNEEIGVIFKEIYQTTFTRKTYDLETKESLLSAFKYWFENKVNDTSINGTTKKDILSFYFKSGSIKSDLSDKEKDEKKLSARIEGDRLFSEFLATALLPTDLFLLNNIWNREYNCFSKIDTSRVPVGFVMNKDVFSLNGNFSLLPAQVSGTTFLALTGGGCLAHSVGFGKTITGILDLSTKLSQGKIKRPLIAVPKPVYNNWIREMFGYWTDGNEKSFEKFEGANFINGVLTGTGIKLNQWYNLSDKKIQNKLVEENSITIVTYEGLRKIGFSKNISKDIIDDIYETIIVGSGNELSVRESEANTKKVEKILGKGNKQTLVDIDICGFDQLTIDEAHNFKNIFGSVPTSSNNRNIWRIPESKPSARGIKLFILALFIQKKHNGNVTLLTATPFTNSVLEIYSMLSLSSFYNLKKYKFQNLYKFVETFVETQVEYAINYLNEIELQTVIKSFKNKNILRELLYKCFDYKENPIEAKIKRPCKINFPNNKVNTYLNMSELQREVQQVVKEVAKSYSPENKGAIGKAMAIAKNNAISPYLFKGLSDENGIIMEGYDIPDDLQIFIDNSPKIKYTVECIRTIKDYHESRGESISGQVIYSNRGISIFEHIKKYMEDEIGFQKRIKFGDERVDEIEIIKGGGTDEDIDRKEVIKDAFNKGVVKVIIGTGTIKEGVNLQERGTVIYAIDIEWNPSDFTQLEGRIHRQGNSFGYVRIVAPLVVNTLDSFIYQKLNEKTERISSLWDKSNDTNSLEEYIKVDPVEIKMELMDDAYEILDMEIDKQKKINFKSLLISQENQKAVYETSNKQYSFNRSVDNIDHYFTNTTIPLIERYLTKVLNIAFNNLESKFVKKTEELVLKIEEALYGIKSYLEDKDFPKIFEVMRQMNARKYELYEELKDGSYFSITYDNNRNPFEIKDHYKTPLITNYSELKKIERLILFPNNLTINDDLSELKQRLDAEVTKNKEHYEMMSSDGHRVNVLKDIILKLEIKALKRGEVMDRVRQFSETNYLLSYPFKAIDYESCVIPTVEYQGGKPIVQSKKTVVMDTKTKLKAIKDFMPISQYKVVAQYIEEHEGSIDSLYDVITTMPKTYGQDGVKDPIVYLHYFGGSQDWYITEKDMGFDDDQRQIQAFGYSDFGFGDGAEIGYISIEELRRFDTINLDMYFDPKKWSEINKKEEITKEGVENNENIIIFEREIADLEDMISIETDENEIVKYKKQIDDLKDMILVEGLM